MNSNLMQTNLISNYGHSLRVNLLNDGDHPKKKNGVSPKEGK